MIITKVRVNNWMGHENKTVEFSEGKNLVFGRNAAGKSSLAKAIAYGLTGSLPKKSDPRRDNNEIAIVDLLVNFDNGDGYLIRRQINKGKRVKDSLFIYEREDASEALYTDTKAEEFLHQQMGISGEVFERVIYMKEEDVHEFLADPENAVITEIDRLIGLEKAPKLLDSINDLQYILKGEKSAISGRKKDTERGLSVKMGVDQETGNLKEVTKRLDEIKIITSDLKQLNTFIGNKTALEKTIQEIKEEVTEKTAEKLETKIIQKQLEKEKEKEQIEQKIIDEKKILDQIEGDQKKNEAKRELKDAILDSMKKEKEEGTLSNCPTCGREMDEKLSTSVITNLQKEIEEIEKTIDSKIKELQKKRETLDSYNTEMKGIERKIERFGQLKVQLTEAIQEINSLESMIRQFDGKNYQKNLSEIDKQLEQLEEEDRELFRKKGLMEGVKLVTDEQVKSLVKQEEEIKHKEKICELIIKAIHITTDKLRTDFSAKVKNKAEEIWSEYKKEKWEIDWDKNFVPEAKPLASGRRLSAYEMSGSERFLMLLAIRLAIQQSLEQFNLLIIDEPCQHLDEINGKAFRDILTSLGKSAIKQSIIFTYNRDFLDGEWTKIVKLSEKA